MDEKIGQYIEEHAVDGVLPAEDMEKLTLAAMSGGDVDAAATGDNDGGDAPDPAEEKAEAAEEKTPEPPEETKEPEPEAAAEPEAEPVIVAKDGRNTIPYSELADAREAAQNERSRREALERELAELKARLEPGEDADGGDTPDAGAENDAAAKLREDWPEVAEAVDGIVGKQQERIKALEEQLARLQPATEQMAAERAEASHYNAITQAHPDAESIVNSSEFAAWREAQPGFMRQIFEVVMERGTTEQVIELLDGFKQANPNWGKDAAASDNAAKAPSKDPAEREAAVKAAREKAAEKKSTPKSLSDIPGAEAAPTDNIEAIMQKAPEDRMRALMNMTPEQLGEIRRRMT